jgi:hypothetical protein
MWWFWGDPGRSRVIGTIARHPIEAFNPADDRLVDTDQFDLPSADETVGDMIRIPGSAHAEAINTSTSVSGLVASGAGGLAMEADSSR